MSSTKSFGRTLRSWFTPRSAEKHVRPTIAIRNEEQISKDAKKRRKRKPRVKGTVSTTVGSTDYPKLTGSKRRRQRRRLKASISKVGDSEAFAISQHFATAVLGGEGYEHTQQRVKRIAHSSNAIHETVEDPVVIQLRSLEAFAASNQRKIQQLKGQIKFLTKKLISRGVEAAASAEQVNFSTTKSKPVGKIIPTISNRKICKHERCKNTAAQFSSFCRRHDARKGKSFYTPYHLTLEERLMVVSSLKGVTPLSRDERLKLTPEERRSYRKLIRVPRGAYKFVESGGETALGLIVSLGCLPERASFTSVRCRTKASYIKEWQHCCQKHKGVALVSNPRSKKEKSFYNSWRRLKRQCPEIRMRSLGTHKTWSLSSKQRLLPKGGGLQYIEKRVESVSLNAGKLRSFLPTGNESDSSDDFWD
jgi:hypothetical protein